MGCKNARDKSQLNISHSRIWRLSREVSHQSERAFLQLEQRSTRIIRNN